MMDCEHLEARQLPATLFVPVHNQQTVVVSAPTPQTLLVDYGDHARTYDRAAIDLVYFAGLGNDMTARNDSGITAWAVLVGRRNAFVAGPEFDFVVLAGDDFAYISAANNTSEQADGRAFDFTFRAGTQDFTHHQAASDGIVPDEVYFASLADNVKRADLIGILPGQANFVILARA